MLVFGQGDCLSLYEQVPDDSVSLSIVDPPYNIDFDYGDGGYKDNKSPEDYLGWCGQWLAQLYRVATQEGAFWLVIGDDYVAELKILAEKHGFYLRSWVVWYYTFGVNSSKKLSRSHTHLLYFTKHKKKFFFDTTAVRVPSARQLNYNDKRANPAGRLPDDTWILRPQELPEGFASGSDTWHIPRVCGTFRERQAGAANQLPEQLVARIIRLCSRPGEIVHDPMAGTGTVPAVAKKLGRGYLAWELIDRFAAAAESRIAAAVVGEPLEGADNE